MAVFYMPFLIAFIIALMVEPIIKWFSRKTKIQRKPSAIIILFLVFAIIVGLLAWGIMALIDEGANLLKLLNDSVRKWISDILWGW
ncbi:MAG: AI-2E family transporter [Clostridia bacterium]|nr:AI-2E family transporter [Clostridia bacterium]